MEGVVAAYFDTCLVCGKTLLTMGGEIPMCSVHPFKDKMRALDELQALVDTTRTALRLRNLDGDS